MKSERREEYGGGNTILDRLPAAELAAFQSHLNVYAEDESAVAQRFGHPLAGAYFPIDAIYSVVVELSNGDAFEVGVIGRDGLVGAELLIGATLAARSVICQGEGRVAYLAADRLHHALSAGGALRDHAQRALRRQWFISQQTVACNFAHGIEQRMARWLLMTHDAVGRPHFPIRLEFLQMMIGASEAHMRSALDRIAEIGAIVYDDHGVTVVSLAELREAACECYERQRTDRFTEGPNNA